MRINNYFNPSWLLNITQISGIPLHYYVNVKSFSPIPQFHADFHFPSHEFQLPGLNIQGESQKHIITNNRQENSRAINLF